MGFHLGFAHILLSDVGYLQDFSAHHFPNILGEEVETDPCLPIEFHIQAKIFGEESYETECSFKPADSLILSASMECTGFCGANGVHGRNECLGIQTNLHEVQGSRGLDSQVRDETLLK